MCKWFEAILLGTEWQVARLKANVSMHGYSSSQTGLVKKHKACPENGKNLFSWIAYISTQIQLLYITITPTKLNWISHDIYFLINGNVTNIQSNHRINTLIVVSYDLMSANGIKGRNLQEFTEKHRATIRVSGLVREEARACELFLNRDISHTVINHWDINSTTYNW